MKIPKSWTGGKTFEILYTEDLSAVMIVSEAILHYQVEIHRRAENLAESNRVHLLI